MVGCRGLRALRRRRAEPLATLSSAQACPGQALADVLQILTPPVGQVVGDAREAERRLLLERDADVVLGAALAAEAGIGGRRVEVIVERMGLRPAERVDRRLVV